MDSDVPKGFLIFIIIVGVLLFAIPTSYNAIKYRNYVKTNATVTYSRKNNRMIYEYNANGQEYSLLTDNTTDIQKEGNRIKIRYNPDYPYEIYVDTFNIFQIIGVSFICLSFVMLFWDVMWLRDLIMILYTSSLILTFLIYKLKNIVVTMLSLLCLVSIMDFINFLRNNKFTPLQDIKRKIKINKEIQKQKKNNLTQKDAKGDGEF